MRKIRVEFAKEDFFSFVLTFIFLAKDVLDP